MTTKPNAAKKYAGACWLWPKRGLRSNGYGPHAMMWEMFRGRVEAGLVLDHLCGVRACVNPDHLEPVTQRENVMRGRGLAAQNARKIRCKRGHPLAGENVYVAKSGSRCCRACMALYKLEHADDLKLRAKARYHAKRAALAARTKE